ncbi:MAG: hypothetical protein IJT65_04920 [Eubacterium sp.]|nr:hypothetical protein [Eubacterium sp.]
MLKLKKALLLFLAIVLFSSAAPVSAFAARTLTPGEEELYDKIVLIINSNLSKISGDDEFNKRAEQYKIEFYIAIEARNEPLSDTALSDFSGLCDHIRGELIGLKTKEEYKETLPHLVDEINSVSAKHGIKVYLDSDYYIHTIISSPVPVPPPFDVAASAPKKANPLKVKGKTVKIKYKTLKKKTRKYTVTKALKFVKKPKGKLSYKKLKGNKKIIINKKTGRIAVKKGLKKGTYKVKVRIKASGNNDYQPSKAKNVTFTVKVVK